MLYSYFPGSRKVCGYFNTQRLFGGCVESWNFRSTIGDIRICEKAAYLFCVEELKEFILSNLRQVKHTIMECREISELDEIPERQYEIHRQTVASARLDNIVAAMISSSRTKANELITQGRVFINSEEKTSNSYRCPSDSVFQFGVTVNIGLPLMKEILLKKGNKNYYISIPIRR